MIKSKKEASVVGGHLQQTNLIGVSLLKRWSCLCINTQDGLTEQIVDGLIGLARRQNNNDAPRENSNGKIRKKVRIYGYFSLFFRTFAENIT